MLDFNIYTKNLPKRLNDSGLFGCYRDDEGDKAPYVAGPKKRIAKVSEPGDWADIGTALLYGPKMSYAGLSVLAIDGLVGIDLDHVRDPETGIFDDVAKDWLQVPCYWEISPSGTGLRGLYYATPDGLEALAGYGCRKGGVEVYAHAKAFRLTCNVVSHGEDDMPDVTDKVLPLMDRHVGRRAAGDREGILDVGRSSLSDDELLERAFNAQNGAWFRRLYEGGECIYQDGRPMSKGDQTPDVSVAVYHLMGTLAFWTGKDPEQMGRLFRQSALYAKNPAKWERLAQREVEMAIIRTKNAYAPKRIKAMDDTKIDPSLFLDTFYRVDLHEARLFSDKCKDLVKWCPQLGYLAWDGTIWVPSKALASKYLHDFTVSQAAAAMDKVRAAQEKAWGEEMEVIQAGGKLSKAKGESTEEKDARHFLRFVQDRQQSRGVNAVLSVAQSYLDVEISRLDADPYLLNTPGGEVDLRTCKTYDNRPYTLCTKATAVVPDASQDGGRFEGFLDLLTDGDGELREYLQRIAGSFLCGVPHGELYIAIGDGGNGKSTFFNALAAVMGSYAGFASSDLLLQRPGQNKQFDLAQLRGLRLVVLPELNKGEVVDTGILKQIANDGGDRIYAAYKGKDAFTFKPTHSPVLYTNVLPSIQSFDRGTWDRIVIIPFRHRFRGTDGEEKNYSEVLVSECGGYILAWMIHGAKIYLEGGLTKPDCVRQATQGYKTDNSIMHGFLASRCRDSATGKAKCIDVYKAYTDYCESTGETAIARKDFYQEMECNGYKRIKDGARGNAFTGLTIM